MFAIDHVVRAHPHRPGAGDDVLRPKRLEERMEIPLVPLRDELHDSGAIPEIEEGEVSELPHPLHPAGEDDRRSRRPARSPRRSDACASTRRRNDRSSVHSFVRSISAATAAASALVVEPDAAHPSSCS